MPASSSKIEDIHAPFVSAKSAPRSATPRVMRYLAGYLKGKRNKKKAIVALLGCSDRTAGRMMSTSRPYSAPMRMEWVYRLCSAVGVPMGDVLGSRHPKPYGQAVLGWLHAKNVAEALQFASDCALSIVYRALGGFSLTGSFSITYDGGLPSEVVVYLSPCPEMRIYRGEYDMHRIVVTAERGPGGKRRMMLQQISPTEGLVSKDYLTPTQLEKSLTSIYGYTKSITAQFRRAAAR